MKKTNGIYLVILIIILTAFPKFAAASGMEDAGEASIQETKSGFAIKQSVSVFQETSKNSKVLKSYSLGHFLKYRTYSTDWYEATVYINGKKQTGYIYNQDVSETPPSVIGYGIKSSTKVYADTSQKSKAIKSYLKGSKLKYKYHSKNWYVATVYINGKKQTGYIYNKDVSETPPSVIGYGIKSSTKVYAATSQKSEIIKSYPKGSKLKYKYHSKNWYIATVYINGKKQTGYIHIDDVGTAKPILTTADKLKTVDKSDQLILVTSKGYKTNKALIRTFEKKNGEWKQVLSMQGFIGKNGFADNKREGDGKSPTGKYTIGTAFGQNGNPGTKLAFKNITSDDIWVDDPKSKLYNTWQSRKKTKGQWSSAENMNHPLYKYGFVINYNEKRTPNKGSAIFFHVSDHYTVGCTATSQSNIIKIMKWINPKKNPVIVQTPEENLSKY